MNKLVIGEQLADARDRLKRCQKYNEEIMVHKPPDDPADIAQWILDRWPDQAELINRWLTALCAGAVRQPSMVDVFRSNKDFIVED